MRRRAFLGSLGAAMLAGCNRSSGDTTTAAAGADFDTGATTTPTSESTRPSAQATGSPTDPPTDTSTDTLPETTTTPAPDSLEAPATLDGGWPMYEFDPGASGFRQQALGSSGAPARRWERSLVATSDRRTPLSALLAGPDSVFVGTYDRGFWRLDPSTGEQSGWHDPERVPVAVGPDHLYTSHLEDDRLAALPGPDATPAWTLDRRPHLVRLTASTLFVAPRAGGVVALDAATGERLWRVGSGAVGRASGLAVGRHHILVLESDRLTCLDAHTGTLQWPFAPTLGGGASLLGPVLADGTAYVGKAGNYVGEPIPRLWAFDVETGDRRWTHENQFGLDPATVGPDLVAGAYRAISRDDGTLAWENGFNPPEAGRRTIRLGDVIYHATGSMGSGPGRLYAFEAASGTRRWDLQFPAGLYGLLAVGDWLIATDLNGTVHGIR